MKKEKFLLKVKRSRKAYLILYLMMLFIIFLIVFLYYQGYSLNKLALISAIIFIIFIIKFIEVHRFREWWAISSTSLIQSTGIFNKNVREIGFSSISDLDLDQPFFKRILSYGNVNVRLFLNETSIKIVDISKPEYFIEELQKLISINQRKKNGIQQI
jgi:membrane protein YdbS with pleckstrin-like domain